MCMLEGGGVVPLRLIVYIETRVPRRPFATRADKITAVATKNSTSDRQSALGGNPQRYRFSDDWNAPTVMDRIVANALL